MITTTLIATICIVVLFFVNTAFYLLTPLWHMTQYGLQHQYAPFVGIFVFIDYKIHMRRPTRKMANEIIKDKDFMESANYFAYNYPAFKPDGFNWSKLFISEEKKYMIEIFDVIKDDYGCPHPTPVRVAKEKRDGAILIQVNKCKVDEMGYKAKHIQYLLIWALAMFKTDDLCKSDVIAMHAMEMINKKIEPDDMRILQKILDWRKHEKN